MKIPDKLKVGGFTFKVIKNYKFTETDRHLGQVDYKCGEIRVGDDCGELKEQVFLHELIHCIDCVYNGNKLSDSVIEQLSQGLYQVLKDNPKLFSRDGE